MAWSLLLACAPARALPPETGEWPERLERFAALSARADLASVLPRAGGATIFAPTDAAFSALGPDADAVLEGARPEALRDLLLRHVVIGPAIASSAMPSRLEAASGETLLAVWQTGELTLGRAGGPRARVVFGDLRDGEIVIHALDRVLLPAADLSALSAGPSGVPTPPPGAAAPPRQAQRTTFLTRMQDEAQTAQPAAEAGAGTRFLTELPARREEGAPDRGEKSGRTDASGNAARNDERAAASFPVTAAELRDMRVETRDAQREGRVVAVLLSPDTGRIGSVHAEFGGFLGFGGKRVALPWSAITVARGRPVLIVDRTGEEIGQAEPVAGND